VYDFATHLRKEHETIRVEPRPIILVMWVYVCVCVCVCVCVHVYVYIHIHTDTHTCIRMLQVEGILIFTNKALRDMMNLKIYVDVEADRRILRR
jgi:uridine kinase